MVNNFRWTSRPSGLYCQIMREFDSSLDKKLDEIAAALKADLDAGFMQLQDLRMRSRVDFVLQSHRSSFKQAPPAEPAELIEFLARGFFETWPQDIPVFSELMPELPSLRHIASVLDARELNKHVKIYDDPCVMKDARSTSLGEFKQALMERVFA